MSMSEVQLPSPTPAYSQPHSTAGFYFSSPQISARIPALPLPSMLSPGQCGFGMGGMNGMGGMGGVGGMGGFGWDRYQEYATIM